MWRQWRTYKTCTQVLEGASTSFSLRTIGSYSTKPTVFLACRTKGQSSIMAARERNLRKERTRKKKLQVLCINSGQLFLSNLIPSTYKVQEYLKQCKNTSSQWDKIDNVWHPVKNIRHPKKQEKAHFYKEEKKSVNRNSPKRDTGDRISW